MPDFEISTAVTLAPTPEAQPLPNPLHVQAGVKFLAELGVSEEVARVMVQAPGGPCDKTGSFAEMIGVPEHRAWQKNVTVMAKEAKAKGRDVSEVITDSLGMMFVRDENDNAISVSVAEFENLKKNGEPTGSGTADSSA